MKINQIFYSFIFVLFSCDPQVGYVDTVLNNSDSSLVVKIYHHFNENWNHDSAFHILPNSQKIIFEMNPLGENPHDEKEDFLKNQYIDSLNINTTFHTSINPKRDVLKRESWTYMNIIQHFGYIKSGTNYYTLEITNQDFK